MIVFLHLIQFISICYFQEILIYETFLVNSFDQDGWNILNPNSGTTFTSYTCGVDQLFGGYQILDSKSVISKSFSLPPHSSLRIQFSFWKFTQNFVNDGINLRFDQYYIPLINDISLTINQTCAVTTYAAYTKIVDQSISHNFENIIIEINGHMFTQNDFWGLNNFALYVTPCPPGCVICEPGEIRQQCISWGLVYSLQEQKYQQSQPVSMFCDSTVCSTQSLKSQKSFIPTHTIIQLKMRFKEINTINSEINLFQIFIHGGLLWESLFDTQTATDNSVAINKIYQQVGYAIQITLKHSYSFFDLNLYCFKNSNILDAYFEINDIFIYICTNNFNQNVNMATQEHSNALIFVEIRQYRFMKNVMMAIIILSMAAIIVKLLALKAALIVSKEFVMNAKTNGFILNTYKIVNSFARIIEIVYSNKLKFNLINNFHRYIL